MNGNTVAGWPDDETLLSFADGKLDAEKAARIAEYLETDAEARRTVALYRRTGELAAQAFDDAMHMQTSPALVDMLLGRTEMRGDSGRILPFRQRAANVLAMPPRVSLPLAASIALVVGGLVAFSMLRDRSAPMGSTEIALGSIENGSTLANLLESKMTGSSVTLPAGRTAGHREVTVVVTFRDRLQRPCREFEAVPQGANDLTIAVACRGATGGWTIEGAAHVPEATESAPPGGFSPAGSKAAMALESVLKMLGATPAMTPDEEAALLASRWK